MNITQMVFYTILVFMVTSIPLLVNANVNANEDRKTNEDSLYFDDDSTTVSQPLEPLHLIVEPTAYELDRNQANEVLRTVNDLVEGFMEESTRPSGTSSKDISFRDVQLGQITGIQFRSSGSSRRRRGLRRSLTSTEREQTKPDSDLHLHSSSSSRALNIDTFHHQGPATILEISGGEVRYWHSDENPSAMSLKQSIQKAVNEHFATTTPTILRSSGSTLEALGIQRISLTWESEGYTLAPSSTPVNPDDDSATNTNTNANPTIIVGGSTTTNRSKSLIYSLVMGILTTIMVIVALFVARRRRARLDGFRRDKVDGSGLEFVHDSTHNADEAAGAFPTFAPATGADKTSNHPHPHHHHHHHHRHSNIHAHANRKTDPSEIEIAIPIGQEVESDISSLSSRGGTTSRRVHKHCITNLSLNKVNNREMYLGTSEGFDFLGGHGPSSGHGHGPGPTRKPSHNPFATAAGRLTNLLGPNGESLWYSSSSASEDTSLQFDVNNELNSDDNNKNETRIEMEQEDSEAKVTDEELSPPFTIPIPPKVVQKTDPKSTRRDDNFMDEGFCDNASSDQSSLGLRSIT